MYKYLLAAWVSAVLVGLVGSAQAYDTINYWGHSGTPVDSNWHNDSNWASGIPTTTHHARIRSEDPLVETHVTVQTGHTALADWITVGGGIWDEAGVIPCPDASLTVEAGATVGFTTMGPAEGTYKSYGFFEIGTAYTGTVHNYGTIDGWEYSWCKDIPWPGPEIWKRGEDHPAIFEPGIFVGYEWNGSLPDKGEGYLFCHDGSLTSGGRNRVSTKTNSKGYIYIYEGASYEANMFLNLGSESGAATYGQVNLLGGTLDVSDHWDAPEDKLPSSLQIGRPDALFTAGGRGELNLESGVFYIEGNLNVLKGTVRIGKDVDATANSDYFIRPPSWTDVWIYDLPNTSQHDDPNDFLTSVEIDIDSQSGVVTHSTMVVNGNTHMDGHMYVENSGDRPKEGDQFTLFDGDAGQTHDGDFVSVTTNLTGGDAGYAVAPVNGDWIATFTGLTGGDANADHKVSIGDLSIMAGNWNQTGFTNGYADADFNCDGGVGIGDLSIMAGNWGWELPGGGVAIPEPATLSLLCLGALAVIRRRRS